MPTSTTPKTSTARRVPQDKKPAAKALPSLEEFEAAELLRAPNKVKASDRMRLLKQLRKFQAYADDEGNIDMETLDFDELADFIDFISEKFAIDSEEFDDWSATSENGFTDALQLAFVYGGVLGK